MARLARVVVPGVAHHVTPRGNRRQETFFSADNYTAYLALGKRGQVQPSGQNVPVPGFLLASFPMGARYLLRGAGYVKRNPVGAKLGRVPWRWRWSSASCASDRRSVYQS